VLKSCNQRISREVNVKIDSAMSGGQFFDRIHREIKCDNKNKKLAW